MNLPESVLLCLFPNGLVLSRQSAALSDGGDNDDYEELYAVDVGTDNHLSTRTSFAYGVVSSTLTVSHMSLPSSGMRPRHSMELLPRQVSLPLNNTLSKVVRLPPTLVLLPHRTPF